MKIGAQLPIQEREDLISFLRQHQTNFAHIIIDMFGIEPAIAKHKLNIDPTFTLIQQKARNFKDEKK